MAKSRSWTWQYAATGAERPVTDCTDTSRVRPPGMVEGGGNGAKVWGMKYRYVKSGEWEGGGEERWMA